MTNPNTPKPGGENAEQRAHDDAGRLNDAVERERLSAQREAEKAAHDIRDEASHFADRAREEGYRQAERGKDAAGDTVDDFAASIRAAADKLGERDQSMASNLVREAAKGLESFSSSIHGNSVQDLTRSVSGFAKRQPGAFLVGATLAGIALGRFARASSEHDESDYVDDFEFGSDDHRRRDIDRRVPVRSTGAAPRPASYTGAPIAGSGLPATEDTTSRSITNDTPKPASASRPGDIGSGSSTI